MDATTKTTVAQTLRGAADYLDTYGWTQGCMFAPGTAAFRPACALGAIAIATSGHSCHAIDALSDEDRTDVFSSHDYHNAVVALVDYIARCESFLDPDMAAFPFLSDPEEAAQVVWELNDNTTSTAGYIRGLLRNTADHLTSQAAIAAQ